MLQGTFDDFHHLFLPNARAWAHENATGPKAQSELGSRLCRLFSPSATEVSVSNCSYVSISGTHLDCIVQKRLCCYAATLTAYIH